MNRERNVLRAVVATWVLDRKPTQAPDVEWLLDGEDNYSAVEGVFEQLVKDGLAVWETEPDAREGVYGAVQPTAKGFLEAYS